MKYTANINGIDVNAYYSDKTLNVLFVPLLEHMAEMHTEKQTRIVTMIAEPPGAGKSTLVSFLEYLAREIIPEKIKGAPVTFDLEALRKKTAELTEGNVCTWPRYDRILHNPVEDAITVTSDIVLLEGNYLLLDLDGWRELSAYADYTISISADEGLLRERLIKRRIATGAEREKAEEFVDFSDMANVRLCLEKTGKADLDLEITHDGTEIIRRECTGTDMRREQSLNVINKGEKSGIK